VSSQSCEQKKLHVSEEALNEAKQKARVRPNGIRGELENTLESALCGGRTAAQKEKNGSEVAGTREKED